MRTYRILPFLLLGLAGCQGEEQPGGVSVARGIATGVDTGEGSFPAGESAPVKVARTDAQFAYQHDLGIGLLPRWVRPHFPAAREVCINDLELRCDLLEADLVKVLIEADRGVGVVPALCRRETLTSSSTFGSWRLVHRVC